MVSVVLVRTVWVEDIATELMLMLLLQLFLVRCERCRIGDVVAAITELAAKY